MSGCYAPQPFNQLGSNDTYICIRVGNNVRRIIKRAELTHGGQRTISYFEVDGTTPVTDPIQVATCPQAVEVVNDVNVTIPAPPPPPPPVTTQGVASTNGSATNVQAQDELSQAVHTPPNTALNVWIRNHRDQEVVKLCNAAGHPVLVQYDVNQSPPVELSRTNMATGAAEPAGALVACPTEDKVEFDAVRIQGCVRSGDTATQVNGIQVVRHEDGQASTVTATLWQDPTAGTWSNTPPTGMTMGACEGTADVVHTVQNGNNTNPPVNAKAVRIAALTGTVSVNGYLIGQGQVEDSIGLSASEFGTTNYTLPQLAVTASGGAATWQWIAIL